MPGLLYSRESPYPRRVTHGLRNTLYLRDTGADHFDQLRDVALVLRYDAVFKVISTEEVTPMRDGPHIAVIVHHGDSARLGGDPKEER